MATQHSRTDVERLEKLILGQLPVTEAERLAVEYADDSRLTDLAEALAGRGDTLLDSLRNHQTQADPAGEQLVERLIHRLKAAAPSVNPTGETLEVVSAGPPAEPIPEKLEYFRIERVLGAGGMGTVYLADDTRLGRRVALKTLKPALAANPAARDRFFREARSAARLHHDHVIPIYYVGEADGVPFLAMPYLDGEPLDARLKRQGRPGQRQPLPIPEAVRIARQTAEGLAAAHAQGLIHRDIKPGNVWLEAPTGRVKILDFGLARTEKDAEHLTASGAILGTPAYMAPEQARGKPVDARADLFSLGCVLYEMLTGRRPFHGEDTMAILSSLALDEPAAPHTLNPQCPPALSALTMQLLTKDPAHRPASADEVARRLGQLEAPIVVPLAAPAADPWADIDDTEQLASPPESTPKSKPAPRRRRLWPVAAGATLLAFVGVGLLFGGTIYRIATNQGELLVEVDDKDVEVKIVQDGLVVQDRTAKREFTLKAGQGQIEVYEKDGIRLATKEFALTRNGQTTVTVTYQELADARKPKAAAPPRQPGKASAPRVTEPVTDFVACHGLTGPAFDEWLKGEAGGMTLRWMDAQTFGNETRFAAVAVTTTQEAEYALRHRVPDDEHSAITRDWNDSLKRGLRPVWDWRYLDGDKTYRTRLWTDQPQGYVLVHGGRTPLTKEADRVLGEGFTLSSITPSHLHGDKSWILVTDSNRRPMKYWLDVKPEDLPGLIQKAESQGWSFDQLTAYRPDGGERFVVISSENRGKPARAVELDIPVARLKDRIAAQRANGLMPWCLTATGTPTQLKYSVIWCPWDDAQREPTSQPDRKAAEWVLSIGGTVTVLQGDQRREVGNLADLPAGAFKLVAVAQGLNRQWTNAGLANLAGCTNLTVLNLGDMGVTDEGLAHLTGLKGLTDLVLANAKLTPAGLERLTEFPDLVLLNLNFVPVTDADLAKLTGLQKLFSLSLVNARVTDAGLAHLKAFNNLRKLGLAGSPVTDAGLAHLAELKGLDNLALSGTQVTDAGLAQLKTLDRLGFLYLDHTQVGDAGLAHLKDLKALGTVTLTNTPVTDAGIDALAACPALRHAGLKKTKVTEAGAKKLAAKPGGCRVEYDGGVIEPAKK